MPDISSCNRDIDFALKGHSVGDKLKLLGAEYSKYPEKGRQDLFEALAMRYLTQIAREESR